MLWVLKSTISMRQMFEMMDKKILTLYPQNFCLSGPVAKYCYDSAQVQTST